MALDSLKPKESKPKDSKSKDFRPKSSMGPKSGRNLVSVAQEKNIYIGLLNYLKKEKLLPVVCFTFSRKRCNLHASLLKSQDFTTEKEAGLIEKKFQTWIKLLKDSDEMLPQVQMMKDHLKRGIAIHHSGILPILKEIIEKLFEEGFVKVLFATETFAMGVNMPTRTVVFDSVRKHDGTEFRNLNPSEYTQMAGRAGRRGKDSSGAVIILCKGEVLDSAALEIMLLGKPTELRSQFKLTYNMILNLLKVRTFRVEDVMQRSFGELDNQRERQKSKEMLLEKELLKKKFPKPDCSVCEREESLLQYIEHLRSTRELKAEVMERKCQQALFGKMLVPGRILAVSRACIPAILLSYDKDYNWKVLAISDIPQNAKLPWRNKVYLTEERSPRLFTITFKDFEIIGNTVLKIDSAAILRECMRQKAGGCVGHCTSEAFLELCALCENKGIPPATISFRDIQFASKVSELEEMEAKFDRFTCTKCPDFDSHFSAFYDFSELEEDIRFYKFKLSEESLELHPEYESRKEVLKELGFIDENETVLLKGSVAREMSNHELLITELLITSVFTGLAEEEVCCLLSCMVNESKSDDTKIELPSNLLQKINDIKQIATKISNEQTQKGVIEPNYVEQYNFSLAPVVYDWARGLSFSVIMQSTDIDEGIIVRSIQRLSELLKDVRSGAKLVGDIILAKNMENAGNAIRRDIVFTESLYTKEFK